LHLRIGGLGASLAAAVSVALAAGGSSAAQPQPVRVFDRLAGCWTVSGQVRGKPIRNLASGRWVLDGAYFLLQLKSAPGEKPYQAAIFFGRKAKGEILVHWLDPFGAEFSQYPGLGLETATGVDATWAYPDGPTRNQISLLPGGRWRMLVTEQPTGKPVDVFSDYVFAPMACGKESFAL
jgi:hypothetical protein